MLNLLNNQRNLSKAISAISARLKYESERDVLNNILFKSLAKMNQYVPNPFQFVDKSGKEREIWDFWSITREYLRKKNNGIQYSVVSPLL
jgi:hypothetical protein